MKKFFQFLFENQESNEQEMIELKIKLMFHPPL